MAALLDHVLENAGFAASDVVSAEAANDFLEKCLPDIILLDLRLPGISGDEWLRSFRAKHPSTLVIAVSGVTDPHRRAELF